MCCTNTGGGLDLAREPQFADPCPNLLLCLLPEVTVVLNFRFIIPINFLNTFSHICVCTFKVYWFVLLIFEHCKNKPYFVDWDFLFSFNIFLKFFHVVEYSCIIFHCVSIPQLVLMTTSNSWL